MDVQVFGVSTDNTPSQKEFAAKINSEIPHLSDFADRAVAEKYGVLIKGRGMANRATFLVDTDGKIAHIEEGNSAINPDGAITACKRIKK